MIKIETDLHTHTLASGHAYSTVDEIAKGAFTKGLKLVAITDHGPNIPGGPHLYHFGNIAVLPDKLYGVKIIKGVEANILDNGKLDLDSDMLAKLDFVSAGIHRDTGHNLKDKDDFTEATIKAMENPYLDMITHTIQREYPVDLEKIAKAAAAKNVIIELNASSYSPKKEHMRGIKKQAVKMLKLADQYGFKIAVNSDAHFYKDVGVFSNLDFLLQSSYFKKELIINHSAENVLNYLNSRKNKLKKLEKTV